MNYLRDKYEINYYLVHYFQHTYDNTLIVSSCCLSVLNQDRSNTQYKYRDSVVYDDFYLS